MPGPRLSHEDRQHIALLLNAGHSYAEIARRLDRPTSTITREVSRNGGAGGYQPDQAHQATERRARRRKPARVRGVPATTDPYGRDPEAVHEFTERFTTTLVMNGFPRMQAKVLACLYTTDTGSMTSAELVARLQVSPASVSTAVRYLEGQQLVSRERDTEQRRDRYFIDEDAWYRAWTASAQANVAMANTARQGAEILGATTPAGTRLGDVSEFLVHVHDELLRAAEHWRQVYAARRKQTDNATVQPGQSSPG